MTKKDDLQDVVNHSITQTLSRSLFTSLTTLVMVGALYIWGVTSIRDFALPLMVGIICGAYSSVCIAGALWVCTEKKVCSEGKIRLKGCTRNIDAILKGVGTKVSAPFNFIIA